MPLPIFGSVEVFVPQIASGLPDFKVQFGQQIVNRVLTGVEGAADGVETRSMPNGAQGFELSCGGLRDYATCRRPSGARDGFLQQGCMQTRHIAGDNQVPFGLTSSESRLDAGQRSRARTDVRLHCKPKGIKEIWWSDQCRRTGRTSDHLRNVPGQHRSPVGQQRLVAAHPRTPPSDENEACLHGLAAHGLVSLARPISLTTKISGIRFRRSYARIISLVGELPTRYDCLLVSSGDGASNHSAHHNRLLISPLTVVTPGE